MEVQIYISELLKFLKMESALPLFSRCIELQLRCIIFLARKLFFDAM